MVGQKLLGPPMKVPSESLNMFASRFGKKYDQHVFERNDAGQQTGKRKPWWGVFRRCSTCSGPDNPGDGPPSRC